MAGKTLILTQKQLDEIVGGDATYLDNVDNDFAEDAANQVYTGEKNGRHDAKPITTDKYAKQTRRDNWFYGLGGTSYCSAPLSLTCNKTNVKDSVSEENQNLKNRKYGNSENSVTNTNASTLKWRYGAAKKKAQSSDPTIRKQGLSTMKTMEKNNPNLKQIETQYNAAMANDANIKKTAHDMGQENVYQKKGGTRGNSVLPDRHDGSKQVITYDN